MVDEIFDRLLLLPLFQGIGRKDIQEISGQFRMEFRRRAKRSVIVRQDEACNCLFFVLGGEVCIQRESGNGNYRLCEWSDLPMVVQPESLFGLSTAYARTYAAVTEVDVLRVEKEVVRDILFQYPTFRINYLNLLSTRAQFANRVVWHSVPEDLRLRFVQFVAVRSLRLSGRKELCIGMEALSQELLATRLNVSRMLNGLQDEGLIELRRSRIAIPKLEMLVGLQPDSV